jgi:hypothetical protein
MIRNFDENVGSSLALYYSVQILACCTQLYYHYQQKLDALSGSGAVYSEIACIINECTTDDKF